MSALIRDLRFAIRVLLHRRRYTVAALLALALGVGANTAILSVFETMLLRPLDYPEADRVVRLWAENGGKGIDKSRLSPVAFADLFDRAESFEQLAGWWRPDLNLTSGEGEPYRVRAINATDEFFNVLAVESVRGRTFVDGEDVSGAPRIAVLGYGLWQSRFGGRDDVIGEFVELDGTAYEVVGVMPSGFNFPDQTELWLPLGWDPHQHSRGARFFGTVGRLKDGVTVDQAGAEVTRFYETFAADFAGTNEGWTATVSTLQDDLVGEIRPALNLLLAAAAFVLLIACANVANLLLAQGAARAREVAVRGALGATGLRLAKQFLTESLLLGCAGGLLGLGVAVVGIKVLVAMAPPDVPRLDEIQLNVGLFLVSMAVALFAGLLFGLAPAWQATRAGFTETLKDGSRGQTAGPTGRRLRSVLVIGEVALAMALLAGAGLLVRSFDRLLAESPGYQAERSLAFNLQVPQASYADWTDVVSFYDRLLDELRAAPGIQDAAVTGFLPLEPGWRVDFVIAGREATTELERPEVQYHTVSPDYFRVMGIPLERGRSFEDFDTADKPGVVLINRATANRYWPGEDPVGLNVTGQARQFGPLGRVITESLEVEIVGVVGDVKNTSLEGNVEPAMYFPHRQFAYRSMHVVVRGQGEPGALVSSAKDAVWRLDPGLPVAQIQSLEQHLAGAVAQRRFIMGLVVCFAALALVLAAIGIYGVVSYLSLLRKQEMGIRIALGATRGGVIRLVMSQGLSLVGLGVAAGLFGSFMLRRTLEALVYEVEVGDPLTFGLGTLLLAVVALLACALPAWRMSRTPPAEVLRPD